MIITAFNAFIEIMSGINQKEYLKKYLSLGSEPGKKKKRKKKSTSTSDRVKIIDDDIDAVVFNQAVEDDLNAQNEDAPQIVGVIDDRPLELRISDYRDSDLWKPLSGEHNNETVNEPADKNPQSERRSSSSSPPRKREKRSRSSNESSSPIRDYKRTNSPIRKSNRSITPNRSRFDNVRNRSDDISPKRKNRISPVRRTRSPFRGNKRDNDVSPIRRNRRDSDISPSRKGRRDGDISPNRRGRRDSDISPSIRGRRDNDVAPIKRGRRDSDPSPPRRGRRDSPSRRNPTQIRRNDDVSPPRRNTRDSDVSPGGNRRSRRDSDTNLSRWDRKRDASLTRGNKYKYKRNISPPSNRDKREGSDVRRNKRDSDTTPPRRYRSNSDSRERRHVSPKRGSREISPNRSCNRNMSPPRRNRKDNSPNRSSTSRYISPNRGSAKITPRQAGDTDSNRLSEKDYNKSKSDRKDGYENKDKKLSPNRGNDEKISQDSVVKSRSSTRSRWDQEPPQKQFSPPPLPKFRDIRKSGLQRANDIIMGKDPTFQPSIEFSDIAGFSGGIAPIVRDRKTGKIRDFKKEEEEAQQKKEKEDELKAKYARWGKGLKQVEDATDKLNSELHEMNKPLARYADDEDLEKHLKEMERDGDPMLQYLRKKRKKQDVESGKPVKPQFEGEFMPNRYGIGPGHRWDGVDRSNGYEKKWFEVMNSRRAQMEDAYKWSTEDM